MLGTPTVFAAESTTGAEAPPVAGMTMPDGMAVATAPLEFAVWPPERRPPLAPMTPTTSAVVNAIASEPKSAPVSAPDMRSCAGVP